MARLIPRKQIEEQQNISGSLNIGQSVSVGNDAIISGSLFVSKSFFLGTNINDRSEITSSIYLTGSLVIDGLLQAASPNTILAITASNSLVSVDTFKYAGVLARDFGANVPTLYVSSTDGNDANDGRSIQFPLRTIKRASQLATQGYDGRYGLDSGSLYNGYVIRVQAGTYLEDNPVILPKNATIWGSGLRITKILAKNKDQDLFWVNSGCYVAEVTVGGMRLWPDQINPERGFGFAFQPGAFITTSPYIQNCSQISNQENSFAELYENIPPGGGGLYVNGDVINPDSPLASMVLDAYTQISPNGVGCLVNGRGFIQLVSFFNNFSYYAIRVNNGGHATLNNSNISFGLYGMYASGSRLISGSGGDLVSRNSIRNTWSCIVDVLSKGYPTGLPTSSILNTNAGIKVTSEPQFFLNAGQTASQADIDEVNANFTLISQIVQNGTGNFRTLLAKSSNKGYGVNSPFNILGGTQTTASIGAGDYELNHISQSFGALLGIFANGTGSYNYKSNTSASISVTGITPIESTIVASDIITGSVSSSFETVINIIKNGLNTNTKVISNTSASIIVGDVPQFTTGESSSLVVVNSVSASFSIVYNILANGTGSSILDVPQNEKVEFNITNTNSSSFSFEEIGENPTITLFRGETYKFHLNAADEKGPNNYPFWIRTKPLAGISTNYDYNNGVINNGDSVGNITFTVPYNAPNELYYVCEKSQAMVGKFHIVNSSTTPIDLIQSTLTYPATIYSSSIANNNVDIINAYDIISANKQLIQKETLAFVSSSWSSVYYNEASCSRDIAYIVDGVIKDLLYGGNEESIRSGLYYYLYPSQATGYEKSATLTGVKYASQLALNLIKNKALVMPDSIKEAVAQCIVDNREFVQKETIAYLSSSWSGGDGFFYNEISCSRDVGYILDAVATDLKYGGNERSITAGQYYYLYPSVATAAGVPSSAKQLEPTLNGVRFAAGVVLNLIKNKSFNNPIATTQSTIDLLKANKELIQNETIQYIGVAYPQLTYNTSKCRRDVGYIIDSIATDLLYGGNERSVIAGNNYYNYPSVATSVQKKETSGAIRYTKIISDYIVQNTILDTPSVVNNDEKGIKVTNLNNYTSLVSGTKAESDLISSSFTIVEGIIKRGLDAIPSLIAQNTADNWGISNPLNVTKNNQITNSYVAPSEVTKIENGFDILNTIIGGGLISVPTIVSSTTGLVKVTNNEQISGSSATNAETASISSSFGVLENIIINGVDAIPSFVSNINNIKVTSISYTAGTPATSTESTFVSSSIANIENIIVNGLGVLPTLVDNVYNNIKVSGETQTTISGSLEDVNFISQSISKVTQIIETGDVDLFAKTNYVSQTNSISVYNTLVSNIPFIQAETIAYLSSSWAGLQYDEAKCKRDIAYIINGAASDYLYNANSASIVNGQFYYEYPSPATNAQFNQTLDGINYASRLAQQIIQNVIFVAAPTDTQNAVSSLRVNKEFIQAETIAYMSSSWGSFEYNEASCSRDVAYIIDNVATDLLYGGNERSRQAGIYYYKYPSQATGSQLQQTVDGVRYASRLAQNIVLAQPFTPADTNKLNASNLISLNKNLIADEVVAYVSSSWSGVFYKEDKCKRDVGYILDAIRTDLVYGGNERTRLAGLYYFLYPSSATVGGVPSSAAQLDPTITGIDYASKLAQNIILNKVLVAPSQSSLNARDLVKQNTSFVQHNTIDFISQNYPYLNYNTDKCFRDIKFIIDGVLTDLVYGGNERSVTSGVYYYKFPNKATDAQSTETIGSINFAKDLTKLIAIGDRQIEDTFDTIINIVESGSLGKPTLIENTAAGIKGTQLTQYTSSNSVNNIDIVNVSASFANTINIIGNGIGAIPNIITNSNFGINKTNGTQITSSKNTKTFEINKVGTEYDTIINIISGGLDSLPVLHNNTSSSIKVTDSIQYRTTASISNTLISNSNTNFDIVSTIIENGIGSLVPLVKNINGLVKLTNTSQYSSSINVSSSKANAITSSFNTVINIIQNGTGSLPIKVSNTYGNIKATNTSQYVSGGIEIGTTNEANLISSSFALVMDIIVNGLSSVPDVTPYVSETSASNAFYAYNLLRANIGFIQSESIAYLSSSWSTSSYKEDKCSRDIGLIISGAMEDLIFNSISASAMSGKYYYLYPSKAETTQLYQTLDGIRYASQLAQKIVTNTEFVSPSEQSKTAYELLINNKPLIQNEVIQYISSSWSGVIYNEKLCKRDVGTIIDSVATDTLYGGNERSIEAGKYYYIYPSRATRGGVPSEANQLDPTLTGVRYTRDLAEKIVKGGILQKASQNKLQAKELIQKNKSFIQNEVIAFVSSSWSTFNYNEASCSRDVAYILDGITTDIVYGGNERSRESGIFYYRFPSQATTAQLAPTLTGVRYTKGLTEQILKNTLFVNAESSSYIAYNLLKDNKQLIQTETIAYVSSSWSFFNYNEASCSRDIGYMIDAVATDILYGGNERAREAGRYYYLIPSNATVPGNGQSIGQLGQTLDGVRYAKGISEKIVSNILLQSPSNSKKAGYDLLLNNKSLIQKETIAFLSSSWSGVDGFHYNQASCSRDVAYIVDAVATDLLYGGNERSSTAGEYYYLYPSKAIAKGSASPDAQLGQTIDGVKFAAGVANSIVSNRVLVEPTYYVSSSVSLLKENKTFIQDETIQYIDAFYPYLVYNRVKCRRDIGYIVDAAATDLWYGGNERGIVAGDYYYRYPNLATKPVQINETVAGIEYAKSLAKSVAQNIKLIKPTIGSNTDANIKATDTNQYTSSISVSTTEISKISSSFSIVTDIIGRGVQSSPTKVLNTEAGIKVTGLTATTSSINGGSTYADLVTSSFNLVRDIIYYGEAGIPDALARNYDYGFELETPSLLHITSTEQQYSGVYTYTIDYTPNVSASYATIIDIVNNGTGSIPTIIENTSASLYFGSTPYQAPLAGTQTDIDKIANGFGIVMDIIKGNYPTTLVSNTYNGIKVTDTPQLISGSGAERLQAKLVSSSFAVVSNIILNGTGSQTYVAPSATANSNPKITSAYNLLLGNKQMIIDETITYMSSSWSTFDYTQSKCERDLGYIIDGVASDLLYGGNSGSFLNGQFYSIVPSEATGSQLDQTLTAIRFASGLAEKVVVNSVLTHISASAETSASYSSLINNKEFIQQETIQYVEYSWSYPNFVFNPQSCSRDVAYIVDAVATDLLYGGNERSIVAGDYYYRYPSVATTSQLQPTLDGVGYAKGLAMNVANNTTFTQFGTDLDLEDSAVRLITNKTFIQDETIAFVNSKYPNLYYDQTKCRRDVGYIVDAVFVDLIYSGNQRAATAGEFYFKYPSIATDVQLIETTAAIDYARRLSEEVIKGNLIPTPEIIPNTTNFTKVTNTPQISGTPGTGFELVAISQSISIVTDIIVNGTGSIPISVPYTTPSTNPNVLNAYNLLKQNIPFIQAETIAYLSSSWSGFYYNEASCSRDVALIVSGAAEDLLWNSNSASIQSGLYYWLVPSQAPTAQLNQTLEGINYASYLAQQVSVGVPYLLPSATASAVHKSLLDNKEFIQNETIAYVSSSWSGNDGFIYNEASCSRDVGYIIDAVATDILYGGNQRSATAGQYYFKYPSQATTGSQLAPTLNAIDFAGGTAKNVITNKTFVMASNSVSTSVELLRNNRGFIQNETMAWLDSAWSFFDYNKEKCKRDVGYILDGIATDLLYDGNERTVMSGEFYYKYPNKATLLGNGQSVGQLTQTTEGILYASRISQKIAQNIVFGTASLNVSASYDLLRNNKTFIAAETIAYVSSSWSSVYYNEASCSRDVRYIIDAAATDLLYGGQERAITAGTYYYIYPSKATKPGVPSEANQLDPTITGVKYGGRLASKVILNPTFQYASQSAVYGKNLLVGNRKFIQKETLAFLSSSWSTLEYNEASCSRDLGFIIDAVSTDLIYGGNERSTQAGSYYYLIPSVAIQSSYTANGKFGQKQQTADGINYAAGISNKLIVQTQLVHPTVKKKAAAQRLLSAKKDLAYKAISYTNGAFPYLVYNEASCSRDTGLIVDACVTDLIYGGNERGIAAASSYYTGQYGSAKAVTNSQLLETLETNRYLRTRAEFIVANAPLESFGSLIVATGIDFSYNGAGVTFKALPPNQGGNGVPNPDYYITELGGGRIYFTSGDQNGNFNIGTGLTINQSTGTLVGRTFNKSLFALVTPYSLALQI